MDPKNVTMWIGRRSMMDRVLSSAQRTGVQVQMEKCRALSSIARQEPVWDYLITSTGYLQSSRQWDLPRFTSLTEDLIQRQASPVAMGLRDYAGQTGIMRPESVFVTGPNLIMSMGSEYAFGASELVVHMDIRIEGCMEACGGDDACLRKCLGIE